MVQLRRLVLVSEPGARNLQPDGCGLHLHMLRTNARRGRCQIQTCYYCAGCEFCVEIPAGAIQRSSASYYQLENYTARCLVPPAARPFTRVPPRVGAPILHLSAEYI